MTTVREWADRRPALVALIITFSAMVYFLAPTLLSNSADAFGHGRQETGAETFAQTLWPEITLAGALLFIVVLIGWARATGLTTPLRVGPAFLALPYVLFVGFIAYAPALVMEAQDEPIILTPADWKVIGIASLAALIVGFFEEVLFRGVLLHGLRSRIAAVPAVLVSAVIFGTFHFVNWANGQPFDATLAQVLGAVGGGVFYGAMVLWTGSIWPSIILHGLWDAGVTLSQTLIGKSPDFPETDTVNNPLAPLTSPELIYGLMLLAMWLFWSKRRERLQAVSR